MKTNNAISILWLFLLLPITSCSWHTPAMMARELSLAERVDIYMTVLGNLYDKDPNGTRYLVRVDTENVASLREVLTLHIPKAVIVPIAQHVPIGTGERVLTVRFWDFKGDVVRILGVLEANDYICDYEFRLRRNGTVWLVISEVLVLQS